MPAPDPRSSASTARAGAGSPLPTPVAAALGLVVTGVEAAKRLPVDAPRLAFIGVTYALHTAQALRREYAACADRGVELVARLTGGAVHTATDVGGHLATRMRDLLEEPEEAREAVEQEARQVAERAREAVERTAELRRVADEKTEAETAEPEVAEVSEAAREAGAPGAAAAAVQEALSEVAAPDGAELDAATLPIPDIDHLTVASIRARLRPLDIAQLVELRAYEQAHANRLQVVTMLENRIAKLEAAAPPQLGATSTG